MPLKLILILLLPITFIASRPVGKFGIIEVSLIDCRTNEEINYKTLQLTNASGGTTKLEWTLKNRSFKKLLPGTYTIGFTSILGRKESIMVDLFAGETKKVFICVDKFTDDVEPILSHNLLNSLSKGQEYKVLFQSHGCFHHKQDSIVISRGADGYFIHEGNQQRELTTHQVLSLNVFELMLTNGRFGGGCTTLDFYSIWINNEQRLTTADGGCDWFGFSYLKDALD